MQNPLFVGLVSFVIENQTIGSLDEFRESLVAWLDRLKAASEIQLFEDYADLKNFWSVSLDEESIEAYYDQFEIIVKEIESESLYWLAVPIRNSLLLDAVPELNYSLKNFRVTYSLEWHDGQVGDFCCRYSDIGSGIVITPSFLSNLGEIFQQHFIEYLIAPGLDTMRDQVSRLFDQKKLEELLKVLSDHVNQKSAAERDAYLPIITRIEHVLGPDSSIDLALEKTKNQLEWLNNGGGF